MGLEKPQKIGHQRRVSSLAVDEAQASNLLTQVLHENDVFVGGSSLGKGLKKAANFYFNEHLATQQKPSHLELPGREDLADDVDEKELLPLEDSFYVVDIAMVVSQVSYFYITDHSKVKNFLRCMPTERSHC